MALWRYVEQSVRLSFFGEATGDPLADTIATEPRQRGRMTKTEIWGGIQAHQNSMLHSDCLTSLGSRSAKRSAQVIGGDRRPTRCGLPIEQSVATTTIMAAVGEVSSFLLESLEEACPWEGLGPSTLRVATDCSGPPSYQGSRAVWGRLRV